MSLVLMMLRNMSDLDSQYESSLGFYGGVDMLGIG